MILILQGKDGRAEGLKRGLEREGRVVAIDLEVDLTSMRGVRQAVAAHRPEAVVLAEAWDDLEGCESNPDRAYLRNAEAVIHMAAACMEFEAVPVLLSTAEVFGRSGGPWSEGDSPEPLSVLAESRLRGETLLARAAKNCLILRTGPIIGDRLDEAWARLAEGVEAADDEYVSPVAALEIGRAIHALLAARQTGLFHVVAPEPPVTRAALAEALAAALGLPPGVVVARSGRSIAGKAARARSAVLVSDRLARHLAAPLAPWRTALGSPAAVAAPAAEGRRDPAAPARRGETADPPTGVRAPDGAGGAAPPRAGPQAGRQTARKVEKPWGHELLWAETERYAGKLIFVRGGERLSLQYHERKDETIHVLSGKIVLEVGPKDREREDLILKPGEGFRFPPNTVHRLTALEDTQLLEASTPELEDVVRLEDKYGRAGTSTP